MYHVVYQTIFLDRTQSEISTIELIIVYPIKTKIWHLDHMPLADIWGCKLGHQHFDVMSLPEPMMTDSQLGLFEQTSSPFEPN